jgi:magnesium chelatase subunit D
MTLVEPAPSAWADARLAGTLFAMDPVGLGGVLVRGGPGPSRDLWTRWVLDSLPPGTPTGRVPARIEDDRLLGGLDAAASLAAGRPIVQQGVLARLDGGVAILAMAERLDPGVAARIGGVLDRGDVILERDGLGLRLPARLGLIAHDEGVGADEGLAPALSERLAFRIEVDRLGRDGGLDDVHDADAVARARDRLSGMGSAAPEILEALCDLAARLGLVSLRAPLFALRVARAHAALRGRKTIEVDDAAAAARLVFAWRAGTSLEPAEPEPPPESDAAPPPADQDAGDPGENMENSETLVAAIAASLPDDLLARLESGAERRRATPRSRGAGERARSARRGRPTGSRPGELRGGARLHLIDTLRAAAPWQRLRRAADDADAVGRVRVRPADFRIRRFAQRLESTTIFVVDASGSTAFQRLAEAKGAVELLLAKAYVSRAHVALIAFRGTGAEILLPPTRSLARAKSRLAELPGGGGTPLAAGISAALALGESERARDRTPLLVFLSDGRANIAGDGAPGRPRAESDALAASRALGEAGLASVFIDTSPRPAPDGDRFARAMGAIYSPLPYVDAQSVSRLVRAARPSP